MNSRSPRLLFALPVALLVAFVGCNKSDKKDAPSVASAPKESAAGASTSTGWAKRAPKSFSGSLPSEGGKFTVDLVDGFESSLGDELKPTTNGFLFDTGNAKADAVSVEITAQPDSLEKDFAGQAKLTKNQKIDRGWIVTRADEGIVEVLVESGSGDKKVLCKAQLLSDWGLKQKDVLLPWFEKMCSTVKLT